jgi:Predicted RNA-binding protein
MSGYKEFEGKTLDEAIQDACSYYDATRDKLEIDILNDAKGGIFGLVGARKARVRARLVELSSVLDGLDSLGEKGKSQKKQNDAFSGTPHRNDRREARCDTSHKEPREEAVAPVPVADLPEEAPVPEVTVSAVASPRAQVSAGEKRGRGRSGGKLSKTPRRERSQDDSGRRAKQSAPKEVERTKHSDTAPALSDQDADVEDFTRVPFDQLDSVELEAAAREMVTRLTESFLGEVTVNVTISNDRVRISLTGVDDPGLLIGRDGQTLASLQYLITRMLSKRMNALLRVQIDAGDYRERQDERLRELALSLAEKVKAGGRPQVTRPLSSYHRRVIHVTLQDDPQIQTHSKGEGEMKRVMIARRKGQV